MKEKRNGNRRQDSGNYLTNDKGQSLLCTLKFMVFEVKLF